MSDLTSWLEAHQLLWPLDEFRSLGRFHACIDAADVKIEAKMHDEVSGEGLGPFKRLELASFGREVGCDVPRWWVFTRASNVQSLLDRTELTFPAAQRLLRSAERVCREMVPTYEQIIRELGGFLQRSKSEIEALCAYVDYLDAEHEFAPAILFSYAVWGSTRRADRSLADYFDREKLEEARRVCLAGELALGVLNSTAPMLILERNELLSEIDEEVDETAIRDRLLHITQIRIRENLVEYFRDIRDSLRHIYTLCQEFSQRETIYSDDRFMRRLIKKISNQ